MWTGFMNLWQVYIDTPLIYNYKLNKELLSNIEDESLLFGNRKWNDAVYTHTKYKRLFIHTCGLILILYDKYISK